jgi:scyllo-inositol 2-dehydrogenase (NADP+)
MKEIITGIASFGMSGDVFHAPLINANSGFNLKYIVERNNSHSKIKYPFTNLLRSFDELISQKDVELIIINTPDDTHYEYALKALKSGKHAIVEKPFTISSQQANELCAVAKQNNLILSVFQNRRWDNDFLTVKKIIENKTLGNIIEFESHFDRFRPVIADNWKDKGTAGTGTLYNLGSHLIDQALVLFGIPESIYANIDKLRDNATTDDYYRIILYYPDIKVCLHSSYLVNEPYPRFIIHGTKGSYIKYGIDPQEQALKDGLQPEGKNWGKENDEMAGTLNLADEFDVKNKLISENGNYPAYYANIFQAIRQHKPLAVKPEEAALVIKVIEIAIKSNEYQKAISFDKN